MFRKIVSNLSFSPALVGQLGFYARRLKKEEATRRLGLVFTALALVVQSLAVFSPPEAANAATPGQVGNAPRCKVDVVGPRGNAFDITGNNKAVVSFVISGHKNCKVQLSVNSFFAPSMDGTPYSQQILHDRKTKVFDRPGRYSLQADLPDKGSQNKGCFYQVDLTYGTYNVQPVLAYGHGKLQCFEVASATCTSLNVIQASATQFRLRAKAAVNKATIKKYVFVITKPNGQTVEKTQNTNATAAEVNYQSSTPGAYTAKVTVHSSVGQDSGPGCKDRFTVSPATPTAVCSGVSATIANRTQVFFKGSAGVSGGATIKSYTFIVKDASGKEVKRTVVTSSDSNAATSAVAIPSAGTYSVQLVVQTSLGDKTNTTTCVKPFTVSPPEVCPYNPTLPPNSPDCQPCPGNPDIWIKDEKCSTDIISTKTATNLTQGNVEASKVTARSGDKLSYTLALQNKGLLPQVVSINEDLGDVLEYATLIDTGGGTYDKNTKMVSWAPVLLLSGQKQSRTVAIQMMDKIPATNTGTGIPTSYDCKMANTYGNTVTVNVDCPYTKKVVETVVKELPETGPRENMIFAAVLIAVVAYFYARSRQLGKEVRLIRREFNAGTI